MSQRIDRPRNAWGWENCPSYKTQLSPEGFIHQCRQSSLDLICLNASLTNRMIWGQHLYLTIIVYLEIFALGFGACPIFKYMPFWDWWTLTLKACSPRPQRPCPCHSDWPGRILKCPQIQISLLPLCHWGIRGRLHWIRRLHPCFRSTHWEICSRPRYK